MMLSVYGSPGSGTSTLSIKLASKFLKKKKKVILVMTDSYVPGIITFFPQNGGDESLGRLLSCVNLTQESILRELSFPKKEKDFGLLSYGACEVKSSYADYTKDTVIDFFIQLKNMADVVIVDAMTAFHEDLLSITAIEMADQAICTLSADLKGIGYIKSAVSVLSHPRFKRSKHINVLSNTSNSDFEREVLEVVRPVAFTFPYEIALKQQFFDEELLEPLPGKKQRFEKELDKLMKSLGGE